MLQNCVGVDMGRSYPLLLGESWGLPRDNCYFGVPDKCISVHFQWLGKDIFAMTMTPLFTHIFITTTKELGTKIISNTTDLLPHLKHYFLWVASTSVSTGWQIWASHQSFWRTMCTFTYSFSWCFLNSFHHFKNRISSSRTKIVDLQAQQNNIGLFNYSDTCVPQSVSWTYFCHVYSRHLGILFPVHFFKNPRQSYLTSTIFF